MVESGFLDRLIERLDRIDPQSLQTQILRLAQERGLLEMIFQSIQEGVMVVDAAGRLSYANRAAEQMLGFSLTEERGRPASRHLKDIDWDRMLRFDEGEWSRVVSQEIEVKYPERRSISFYMVPMLSRGKENDGAEGGVVLILRDITRDREQEAHLLESERLNAVKLLAAGVAHEIGNPLNALNIHLQLLARELERVCGREQADLKELVQVARDEVRRLDVIITQFLQAVRPAAPDPAPCRVEAVLKDTLALLKQEIQNRNIAVEINKPRSLPRLSLDADQIKQAFFNVIRNAFQAMPDGGTLGIDLSSNDDFLRLDFRDTGEGIAPQNLSRIFEPYHTSKRSGSGLGLMIVQRIVQEHGGQIEVASRPGKGTVFTILLPLAEKRVRLLPSRRRQAQRSA